MLLLNLLSPLLTFKEGNFVRNNRIVSLLLVVLMLLSIINFEAVFAENASEAVVVESETEALEDNAEANLDLEADTEPEPTS